jgi:tellurite resistance protein TerC
MPAPGAITVWHWAAFVLIILVFLGLDLAVFHRTPRAVKPKEALAWSVVWLLLAMAFAGGLAAWLGPEESLEFVTGYFVEYSLSLDNVAAIALIFAAFGVAARQQHRVLFWGILGALLMRGVAIGLGATLIQMFHWVLYVMGAFLVFTGLKWGLTKNPEFHPEDNPVLRLARRIFRVSGDNAADHFLTWQDGRRALTPLALALLMVETADLIFAVDSIPAIFAVTQKAFIVFTSNCFAILGLRSLYFVVAGALAYFRFLKAGLAGVLVFVGAKMLASSWYAIPTGLSLAVVAAIISLSVGWSILTMRRETRT